jgi:putative ubiquitin-RnfH superfamily antitoxin RatB of RatAB toxin-antitoxin module
VPPDSILIEVVYAEPRRAVAKQYRLHAPATVADALRRAAADPDFHGVDVAGAAVGVFGRAVSADQGLNTGAGSALSSSAAAPSKSFRS